MKWTPALKVDQFSDNDTIRPGDKIKIYGKETTVTGFYGTYNDGLEKWETIILTEGRGDPFERSIDVIEVQKQYPPVKSPTTADASVLVEALEKIYQLIPEGADYDPGQFVKEIEAIVVKALSQYNALPGSQGGEEQSIIDKCETAVEVLRTMLKKLKMPIGVDAADSILKQIKGYKIMNQKEDTGPQSMPLPVQEPLQSTQSLSSIEESGLKEGEDKFWDDFAIEYEALQRMEENTWEWNRSILKEKYRISKI